MTPIVPAVIPNSLAELKDILPKLAFSPEVHIDVVDGVYVPFSSWPYDPSGSPEEITLDTNGFTLEIDLMVKESIAAAQAWLQAGADMLVFHTNNIDPQAFKSFVASVPVSVGIAIDNQTSLSVLDPYLNVADYLQLMGISEVGAQGQPFDERVLERIELLRRKFPKLSITVDGSVNQATIKRLYEAGADRFVCGSAIVAASDPEQVYLELQKLIN